MLILWKAVCRGFTREAFGKLCKEKIKIIKRKEEDGKEEMRLNFKE